VVSPNNKSRREVNAAIRRALQAKGRRGLSVMVLNVLDILFLARARRGPRPFAIIPDHWRPDILKNNFPVADDAANLEIPACRMASGWIYPALLLRSTEVLQFLLERRSGAVPGPSVPGHLGHGVVCRSAYDAVLSADFAVEKRKAWGGPGDYVRRCVK